MVNGYAPDVLSLTGCQLQDRDEPCGIQLTELIVSRYYFQPRRHTDQPSDYPSPLNFLPGTRLFIRVLNRYYFYLNSRYLSAGLVFPFDYAGQAVFYPILRHLPLLRIASPV